MKIKSIFTNSQRWLSELMVGGSWGRTQSEQVQANLKRFWFDGLFASGHDNIYLNFISLYVLVLGATQAQIGLMSSFSNLTAALLLLPGAFLAERSLNKKRVVLLVGGIFAKFALLLLVFIPMIFKGSTLIWAAIFISVIRDGLGNLAYPAWMAVTNEVVPLDGRGRYFGARNFIMGIVNMLSVLLVGKLITLFVHQTGYQIALGAAFIFGILSTYSYAHIKLSPTLPYQDITNKLSLSSMLQELKGQSFFIKLMITAAIWNFAINISGPFFNVHMLQTLHFDASEIGLLTVVSTLAGLLIVNKIGTLSDKLGARKMQLLSMIVIPLLPLGWIICTKVWQLAILNTFNGIFWGAFNLASFNLLLESMPSHKVPIFSAIYQVVVTLALSLGALVGSGIISIWGFVGVLIASAAFRWIACGLFGKFAGVAKNRKFSLPLHG